MGQTPAETKREIAETRAQLTQTLAALETKAKAAVDWRARLRSRPWLGVALGGTAVGLLVLTGLLLAPASPLRRRRRRSLPGVLRGIRPRGPRLPRGSNVPDEVRPWLDAQLALLRRPPERASRRIMIRAAEAGVSALAAGLVRLLIARAQKPRTAGR